MSRYQFKIVSNQKDNTLSYFIKNEKSEWIPVSNASVLSRSSFIRTTLQKNGEQILKNINEIYNIAGDGLDLHFFGSDNDYKLLTDLVEKKFSAEDICCHPMKKVIAVLGRLRSGKTTLLTTLMERSGNDYRSTQYHNIWTGIKEDSSITWCELPGIDLGKDNLIAAAEHLKKLTALGLTDIIYCFGTSKTEDAEKNIIRHIQEHHPATNIVIALTRCLDEQDASIVRNEFPDMPNLKVIATMAKELKTRGGTIAPYGIDRLLHAVISEK